MSAHIIMQLLIHYMHTRSILCWDKLPLAPTAPAALAAKYSNGPCLSHNLSALHLQAVCFDVDSTL